MVMFRGGTPNSHNDPRGSAGPRQHGRTGKGTLATNAPCICGGHTFGGLVIATGLTASRGYCPVCHTPVLIIRRRHAHIATLRFEDDRPEAVLAQLKLAQRLGGIALTEDEVDELGVVAQEIAGVVPPVPEPQDGFRGETQRTGVRRRGAHLPPANTYDR